MPLVEENAGGGNPAVLAQVLAEYKAASASTTSSSTSSSTKPKNSGTKNVTTIKKASSKSPAITARGRTAVSVKAAGRSVFGDILKYTEKGAKLAEKASPEFALAAWAGEEGIRNPRGSAAVLQALALITPGPIGATLEALSFIESARAGGRDLAKGNYFGAGVDALAMSGYGLGRTAKQAEKVIQTELSDNSKLLSQVAEAEHEGKPLSSAGLAQLIVKQSSLRIAGTTSRSVQRGASEFSIVAALIAAVSKDKKRNDR